MAHDCALGGRDDKDVVAAAAASVATATAGRDTLPAPPSYEETLNGDCDVDAEHEDDEKVRAFKRALKGKFDNATKGSPPHSERESKKPNDESDDDFGEHAKSLSDFDHVTSFCSRKQGSLLKEITRTKGITDVRISASDLLHEAKVDGISSSTSPTPTSARSLGTRLSSEMESGADAKHPFTARSPIKPIHELTSGFIKISCPFCIDGQIAYDGIDESSTRCSQCSGIVQHAFPSKKPRHPPRNPEDELVKRWRDSKVRDKDTEIKIILDSEEVFPLKTVSGSVSFQVLQKTKIQCVKIAFVGLEHLKIFNKVKGPNVITKKIFFFRRVLFKSRSFWDKVDKLKENFPFTFKVPGYAPPSLSYGNREGCWIDYKIQVAVIKSGSKKLITEGLVRIIPAAVHPYEGLNAHHMKEASAESKVSVGGLGCFAGGHLRLKVRIGRTCFAKSERMVVPMFVEVWNLTDSRISRLSVELRQTVLFLRKKLFSNHALALFKSKTCFGIQDSHHLTGMLVIDFPLEDAIPNMESRNIMVKHSLTTAVKTSMEQELHADIPILVEREFDGFQTHQYTSAFASLKEKLDGGAQRTRARSELFDPLNNDDSSPDVKKIKWRMRSTSTNTWSKGTTTTAILNASGGVTDDRKSSRKKLLAASRTWDGGRHFTRR